MAIARMTPAAPPRMLDLASELGVQDASRVLVRELSCPRGASGARQLERLGPAVVVEGAVLRAVALGPRTSAALHGPGDIFSAEAVEPLPFILRCLPLTSVRVVPLDDRAMASIATAPAVASALATRLARQSDELGLQTLITQLVSIEERLGVLLPRLADRWGTVTATGVVLPAFLSHSVLSALIGVRRPSLTTAIAAMGDDSLLSRLPDRRWLVAPDLAGLARAA